MGSRLGSEPAPSEMQRESDAVPVVRRRARCVPAVSAVPRALWPATAGCVRKTYQYSIHRGGSARDGKVSGLRDFARGGRRASRASETTSESSNASEP